MKKGLLKLIIGLLILLAVMILIPIVLYYCIDQNNVVSSNIEGEIWLPFLGTYIATCAGSIITFASLMYTVIHIQSESEIQMKKDQWRIERQLLQDARPILVIYDDGNTSPNRLEVIYRYAYMSDESDNDVYDLKNYDYAGSISFIIKNIGYGPAENIRFDYESAVYNVGGFDDRIVQGQLEDAPVLFHKMSFDVTNEESVRIQLHMHMTSAMKDTPYAHQLSFIIRFEDYRHNQMQKTITVDFDNRKVVGWDSQSYSDQENQNLFEGIFQL